uniref:Uncharacterized protein n=1 Tax=Palpitomonas bilix TaxID=652834 RepID=A0A7S3G8A0_9EUKA|mmetsp:Transcript_27623/g.70628  ORF Transcript_27623/g.70628 Transcript_27623/m.70628 type:complete len:862 (+) Transcript_27623:62-2647(+)
MKAEQGREKRRRIDVPPRDASLAPPAIPVLEFAAERIREIKMMKAEIESFRGVKRVFQTLPRHLRRRATSHRARKLPKKAQKLESAAVAASEETAAKSRKGRLLTRYRKYRRKKGLIMSAEAIATRKVKWLETHLWHTKRMKMDSIWGHRLALHRADKGSRASYRAHAHLCTVQDKSYLGLVEISGSEEQICSFFRHHFPLPPPSSIASTSGRLGAPFMAKYRQGCNEGVAYVYEDRTFATLICPVRYLWRPLPSTSSSASELQGEEREDGRTVWMWVHPASFDDVMLAFNTTLDATKGGQAGVQTSGESPSKVVIRDCRSQVCRLSLVGPFSTSVLANTIVVKESDEGVAKMLELRPRPSCLPAGSVAAVKIAAPFEVFPPAYTHQMSAVAPLHQQREPRKMGASFKHSGWQGGEEGRTERDERRRNAAERSAANAGAVPRVVSHSLSSSSLWQHDDRQACLAHKKREWDVNMERRRKLFKGRIRPSRWFNVTEPGGVMSLPFNSQSVPCFVVQTSPMCEGGKGCGLDIILPAGFGRDMLKSLVYAGARVVGLKERWEYENELGLPRFPQDFPETKAYREWELMEALATTEKYLRRPCNKRPDYDRMRVHSPLWRDWKYVFETAQVQAHTEEGRREEMGVEEKEEGRKEMEVDVENEKKERKKEEAKRNVIDRFSLGVRKTTAVASRAVLADSKKWIEDLLLKGEVTVRRNVVPGHLSKSAEGTRPALVQVFLSFSNGGRPKGIVHLYRPLEVDMKEGERCEKVVCEEAPSTHISGEKPDVPSRELVGLCTARDPVFQRGVRCALGFVSASKLDSILKEQKKKKKGPAPPRFLLLARSSTSYNYRLVDVTVSKCSAGGTL